MNVGLLSEIALTALLSITLIYCMILERRLSAMRREQKSLSGIIGNLNTAIANAGAAMRALKATAAGAADTLDDRLARARASIDELSLLTASGERIAERFDRTATQQTVTRASIKTSADLPSGSIMGRLDTLKAVR